MFDLAETVLAWTGGGRTPWVARVVFTTGMGSHERLDAAAYADGGQVGAVLSGAADDQVRAALDGAVADGRPRLLDVQVDDHQAHAAGLTCAGTAQVLLQPARDIPAEAWRLLAGRTPVCLVTDLTGASVGRTSYFARPRDAGGDPDRHTSDVVALFGRGTSEIAVTEAVGEAVMVAALWPTTRFLVVGDGLIAEALGAAAQLMDWAPTVVNDVDAAAAAIDEMSAGDGIVVLSHDRAVDAPVLARALASAVGYVAALGSRHTQTARAEWLREHGVAETEIARVHGPAGLDIGSRTPKEIAVAIVAELIAARSGASGTSLAAGDGPIHADGLHTPPARYPVAPAPG